MGHVRRTESRQSNDNMGKARTVNLTEIAELVDATNAPPSSSATSGSRRPSTDRVRAASGTARGRGLGEAVADGEALALARVHVSARREAGDELRRVGQVALDGRSFVVGQLE